MEEKTFTVEHEGETREFLARTPNKDQELEAQRVYNRAWKEAIDSGSMLKDKVIDVMMDNGLWSEEQDKSYRELVKTVADKEYQLNSGKNDKGEKLKVSEGRELALDIRSLRMLLQQFSSKLSQFDSVTAEGMADQAQFEYMVAVCVLDPLTMKPFFTSLQDYKDRATDELTVKIAGGFAKVLYGLSDNYEDELVENKFLRRFNFTNDKHQLVDKEGNLINHMGERVDEEGYLLNEDGKRVDINGNPVLEEGVSVETAEFEDDTVEEKPKRRRKKAAVKQSE